MSLLRCIWCSRGRPHVSFEKKAHIVPQSLGGNEICKNVCDECNAFFGNRKPDTPSIEETIKEAFIIPRTMFLEYKGAIGKNKALVKPSSRYFKLDWRTRSTKAKQGYSLDPVFQRSLGIQLRRGIYKMYLETISHKGLDANQDRYDFIRSFARYGLGDPPVFYFLKRSTNFLLVSNWTEKPTIRIGSERPFDYLVDAQSFTEFDFLGRTFGIATSGVWQLSFDQYARDSSTAKADSFRGVLEVHDFDDIDLALTISSKGDDYEAWIRARQHLYHF